MKYIKISYTALWLLCVGTGGLYAQQNANAAGGDATGSGGSFSYTIGQVGIPLYNNAIPPAGFNPGVQQPYEFYATGINELKGLSLSMSAYPNPAQATLNLQVEEAGLQNLTLRLYDVSGRLVLSQKVSGPLTAIPMQKLPAGTYLLKVSDTQQALKTFAIIKND